MSDPALLEALSRGVAERDVARIENLRLRQLLRDVACSPESLAGRARGYTIRRIADELWADIATADARGAQ